MSILKLHFGPTVTLVAPNHVPTHPKMYRAFALVSPDSWGKKDWKEAITAVIHPVDLENAGVSLEEVLESIEFYTATKAAAEFIPVHGEPGVNAYVIRADGYRKGEAW